MISLKRAEEFKKRAHVFFHLRRRVASVESCKQKKRFHVKPLFVCSLFNHWHRHLEIRTFSVL